MRTYPCIRLDHARETSLMHFLPSLLEEKVSLLPEIITEEPAKVVEKSPSPARNSPAQILSIFNLVRPFTLRQLRELLSKTGTLVEDGFWINKIKSHCYVTVSLIENVYEYG